MNFNITRSKEYELIGRLTSEYIRLFGLRCRYYVTDKLGSNKILGENSRISYDPKKSYEIYIAPSNTENWDGGSVFSSFGFQNQETLVGFISVDDIKKIHPKIFKKEGRDFDSILGDIVIFDSGKIMEVTSFSPYSEGSMNNLYAYSDDKNVYKITLRTHIDQNDDITELKSLADEDIEIKEDLVKVENLEEIFGLQEEDRKEQKTTRIGKKQTSSSQDFGYNSDDVFGGF